MNHIERISTYISQGESISEDFEINRWQVRVAIYLKESFDEDVSSQFRDLVNDWESKFDDLARQIGFLEALEGKLEVTNTRDDRAAISAQNQGPLSNNIFVVHGHDNEAKETSCRFLEKLGLSAIVLHEQPNEGRTIVEKFEQHSNVAFAVVLLTPDDLAKSNVDKETLAPRARQNVILELGYFIGKLGRKRVCALTKGNVEIPSDYHGVLYVEMDDAGAWRNKLAQELISSRVEIDLSALV